MSTVKFSVVIPLYNKVNSISRTLESINKQRFAASEIIVIDDGSIDGSAEKVAQLKIANLILVQQTNQGVSAARNTGVAMAKHDYVAFIDADDQWSAFYLYEMNKLIQRFPEQQCFASNYQKVVAEGCYQDPKLAIGNLPPEGSVMHNYFDICAKGDLPFMPSSLVISTELFTHLGGFPIGEAMGEDQALFAKIALHSSLVYSPLVLMLYHTDSENRACDIHLPQELLPFAQRLLLRVKSGKLNKSQAAAISKYCAAHACHLIKMNLQAGNLATARRLLKHPICMCKPLHQTIFSCWLVAKLSFSICSDAMKFTHQSSNPNSQ